MKSKINIILPIAFAIILPGFGFISNNEMNFTDNSEPLRRWVTTAIMLYILWHLTWPISNMKSKFKNWIYFLIPLLFFMILSGISFQLNHPPKVNILVVMVRFIFAFSLILIIQNVVKSQQNISALLLEKEQLQTENYKTQLQALRTQIDPHFLFNSLNTLRSMVRQQHSNSEEFVMSLSDFYRKTLQHNNNTTLPLFEEIKVLESYLFLMKSRNEGAIKLDLNVDSSLDQFHLPTLALQMIVENCFKHNSMTSKLPLHIEIKNTIDFYIIVNNNLQPKIGDIEASGFGLDLLKKRYELMNISEGLLVEKTADQFSVKLKLIRK